MSEEKGTISVVGKTMGVEEVGEMLIRVQREKNKGRNVDEIFLEEAERNLIKCEQKETKN